MLISVCIPVWNREKYIGETIESVLAQTYTGFEIVIVDDGSTDNTKKIIKEYMKKDIRVRLIEKEHVGATDTFNQTILNAKGDYICILGSDDLWMPTKLEEQVKVSKDYPDYILHTKSFRINDEGDVFGVAETLDATPEEYYKRAKEPWAWFIASSFFMPKKMFDEVGLFPDTICQDYHWALNAILLHNKKMKLIPKVLVKNRTNTRSTTSENGELIQKEAERIRLEVLSQIK